MAVDQWHTYSNEARIELDKAFMVATNWNKPFGLHGLYKKKSAL